MDKSAKRGVLLILLGILLVVIDQVIKVLVKTNMDLGEQIPVIGQWFRICLCGALVWWISSLNKKGKAPVGVLVGLTLITAGAFGNIIDSLFYGVIWDYAPVMFGKVVDMIYFPIIRSGERVIFFSPVFNFADSCVTVGAFYLILFQWRFFAKDEKEEPQK